MTIDEAIERLKHIKIHGADIPNESIDIQRRDIEALPLVTPTRKKGKWVIKASGFPPEPITVCSECGFDRDFYIRIRGFDKIKYCPGCGAKMER